MGQIQLRCKVFPLAFLLYLFKPRVSIDNGPELTVRWGVNPLPVPPGRHHLRVWFPYLFGPANVGLMAVDVPEGQSVAVVYKTRWMVFLPGIMEVEGWGGAPGAAPGQVPGGYGAPPQGQFPHQPGFPQQPMQPQPQPFQPQPQAQAQHPEGWLPDPTGRHQHRWWDGQQWTANVADGGTTGHDPL
jgi:uncharacterized protein DUF2510